MLTFLRKIRKSLIETGSAKKYLLYAIGEITLVVIGILIALQINNWNESRKSKNEFQQSLIALSEDIRNDTSNIQTYMNTLEKQVKATALLIPILESENQYIRDSLEFIQAFMTLSLAAQVDMNTEIWDDIRTSGLYKVYASSELVKSIQDYYKSYKRYAKNWQNGYRTRIEMRELKYEFLSQRDLDLIRSEPTKMPSHLAFNAILNDPSVLTLTKSIKHTSSLFFQHFTRCIGKAEVVIKLIELETKP
jgi:hypothetical protein